MFFALPDGITFTDRLKGWVNQTIAPWGYEVNNLRRQRVTTEDERVLQLRRYTYVRPDGSFDYQMYRSLQAAKNRHDIDQQWTTQANMRWIGAYLTPRGPRFGLCHGAKKGTEVVWLREALPGCHIVGTDISETANDYPDAMIQWDFHETQPAWIGATDFIYTNALDHSYDPEKALDAWVRCLRPGGVVIIEWCNVGEALDVYDPFSADILQLVYAITLWGKGAYCVREVVPTPKGRTEDLSFVIVHKF
jgi:SAM-dependent methyltransferase